MFNKISVKHMTIYFSCVAMLIYSLFSCSPLPERVPSVVGIQYEQNN